MKDRVRGAASDAEETIDTVLGHLRHYVDGFYARAGALLTIGLVMSLLCLFAVSRLTEDVLEGETLRFDQAVLHWLQARGTSWLDHAALEITALGDTLVVLLVVALAGAILWLLERRAYAFLLGSAVVGAAILSPVLKALFDRSRPDVTDLRAVTMEASASYPSGHAMMSMVSLLVAAYIVRRLGTRRSTGVVAMLVAGVLILLIGLSRLYLGVHYPSDVAAGYMIGFAWSVFCVFTLQVLRRGSEGSDPPMGGGNDPRARSPAERCLSPLVTD